MEISLHNTGRRFNKEWIFREVNATFVSGGQYAILGPNGSGKSTLLSIISGSLSPSEGSIRFSHQDQEIAPENIYRHTSLAAPYLDLVEEFSLMESIRFHFKFKPYGPGLNEEQVFEILGLTKAKDKAIKYFSSGMKQRTKLVLACCADTPILLLDEPTSNLDHQGVEWYHQLIERFSGNKLVVVCSNQPHEYSFCKHYIKVTDFK